MTKQRSARPEQVGSSSESGTDVQTDGGPTPPVGNVPEGNEPPTAPPPPDNNNPNAPAAAIVTADRKDPHPAENENRPIVPDLDADEERRDATDKPDQKQKRKREPEPLNDAVGSSLIVIGGGRSTWKLKNGREFGVSRYYPTKKVVIDFPYDEKEAAMCDEKRAKLHEFGVAYVAIMPGKNMTTAEIIEAIDRERAVLAGKGE